MQVQRTRLQWPHVSQKGRQSQDPHCMGGAAAALVLQGTGQIRPQSRREQRRLSPPSGAGPARAQDQAITNCSHMGSDTGTLST